MTKDETRRLAALEAEFRTRLGSVEGQISEIGRDVKALLGAHEQRIGADRAKRRLVSWAHAAAVLFGSIFGGGIGAVMVKKLG